MGRIGIDMTYMETREKQTYVFDDSVHSTRILLYGYSIFICECSFAVVSHRIFNETAFFNCSDIVAI